MRALTIGAPLIVLSAAAWPAHGAAQALNSGSAGNFIKSNERPLGFKKAARLNDACHVFSPAGDLKFCPDGTEWQLEGARTYENPTLYRLDDGRKAALRVIQMKNGESRRLTPDQIDELVEKHAFFEGPRGERRLDALIAAKRDPEGKLYRLEAFAQEADGTPVLLQLGISFLDYGLGLTETTITLPRIPEAKGLSEDQVAFDAQFRTSVRVAIGGGVKQ